MSRDRFFPPALLLLAVTLLAACTAHTPTTDPPTRPFSRIGAVSHTALFPRIEAGQHTAPIRRIGVDAAGRWLVTASDDKTARIWDLKRGALQRVLRPPIGAGNEGKLSAAALSPDGRLVAVGGWTEAGTGSHNIYLFDRATGALVRRIGGLPEVILHLEFSPDGTQLAAALWGGEGIRVYRTDSWVEIGRDADYGADSYWVDFDGRGRLVTSSMDGFIRLYDSKLRLIAKKKAPGGERPFGVAFAPDGNRIAVGFHDSTAVDVLSGTDLSLRYSPDTSDMDKGDLSTVAWSRNGRTLFAAGRYQDDHGLPLVSWPEAGRGSARIRPIAKDAVMDLVSLADGRLVFGAQDPAWGLLDAVGRRIRGQGPTIADFRTPSDKLRLSDDGRVVEVDFDVLGTHQKWKKHVLRLDLAERRLELDPHRLQRRLAPPRIQASGLSITDWRHKTEPKLNGNPLILEPFETSWSLDIAKGGGRFLLGTAWSLRLYQRNGDLIWKVPAPSVAMMVKLSGDGRWAVAAFGDGSLRWFEVANQGRERLALFLDGAAIGARKHGGKAATVPWLLWTPEGFFHSAGGGERLMGWHRNRGADRAGELLNAGQIGELFRRPDLVAQALDPGYPQLAQAALQESGGLERLLAGTQAPRLERLGPAQVRVTGPDFTARFRLQDRGSGVGRIQYRVDGVLIGQGDERGRFGLGLPNRREESRPFYPGAGPGLDRAGGVPDLYPGAG
ncbi:WD40 repeat domain-containing protein [Candidatus Thiosymbion oneisti]|uniref:WD40 repeat domain-containing protein n=1 Tax=Candidatus Thiosymbion oneisti TaxID=589554 RepID=UPI000B0A32FF|nr:hypothetical protein [Candidatus Thiosymbion oneisti]